MPGLSLSHRPEAAAWLPGVRSCTWTVGWCFTLACVSGVGGGWTRRQAPSFPVTGDCPLVGDLPGGGGRRTPSPSARFPSTVLAAPAPGLLMWVRGGRMTWARGRSPRAPPPSAHAPRGRDSAALAASLRARTFQGPGCGRRVASLRRPRPRRPGPAPAPLCFAGPAWMGLGGAWGRCWGRRGCAPPKSSGARL